jgi:hypothetical protein
LIAAGKENLIDDGGSCLYYFAGTLMRNTSIRFLLIRYYLSVLAKPNTRTCMWGSKSGASGRMWIHPHLQGAPSREERECERRKKLLSKDGASRRQANKSKCAYRCSTSFSSEEALAQTMAQAMVVYACVVGQEEINCHVRKHDSYLW